jgi:dTDP-4-amino-4,6-dideoxygalactose transaminase
MMQTKLALHGGNPVISENQKPVAPRRWGKAELDELADALDQDSLFYWQGPKTRKMIAEFQREYPLEFVMPCSSGTASIHIALLAMNLKPGDEVITSPITDQGTVIGTLYQQGVPIFADVDAETYNIDPQSVAQQVTPRTRAIIAVHLAGNPCNLEALKAIALQHNLVLIEDCAQAWGARYREAPVGTIGQVGCYSLNDFKHVSCGDGGIVASNDATIGPLLQMCGDKGYDRINQLRSPGILAPCYRISELQAAVGAVQLSRMRDIAECRNRLGELLTREIEGVPGVRPHKVESGGYCSYWFYMFRISPERFQCSREQFVEALNAEGLAAGAGYIPEPLYHYPVFTNRAFFGGSWPARELGKTTIDYRNVRCPNAEAVLQTAIRVDIKEWMNDEHIRRAAEAIRKVAGFFAVDTNEKSS